MAVQAELDRSTAFLALKYLFEKKTAQHFGEQKIEKDSK